MKIEQLEKEARDEEVRTLKEMMAEGMTNQQINEEFNGQYPYIFLSEIRTGKIYKHIDIGWEIGKGFLKLSDDDVREIKKLLYQGVKHAKISEKFKVSRVLITKIHLGKTWSHITFDESQLVADELKEPRKSVSRKLTEDNVREIKRLLKQGELSHSQIAKKFGIASSGVTKINTGKRWSHINI